MTRALASIFFLGIFSAPIMADDACVAQLLSKLPFAQTLRSSGVDPTSLAGVVEPDAKFIQQALRRQRVRTQVITLRDSVIVKILPDRESWQGRFATVMNEYGQSFGVAIGFKGVAVTLRSWGVLCSADEILKPVWPSWLAHEIGGVVLRAQRTNFARGEAFAPPLSLRVIPQVGYEVRLKNLGEAVIAAHRRAFRLSVPSESREIIRNRWAKLWANFSGFEADEGWMLVLQASEDYSRALILMRDLEGENEAIDRVELRETLRSALSKAIDAQVHAFATASILKSLLEDVRHSPLEEAQVIMQPKGSLYGDVQLAHGDGGAKIGVRAQEVRQRFGFSENWQSEKFPWVKVIENVIARNEEDLTRAHSLADAVARTVLSLPTSVFRPD